MIDLRILVFEFFSIESDGYDCYRVEHLFIHRAWNLNFWECKGSGNEICSQWKIFEMNEEWKGMRELFFSRFNFQYCFRFNSKEEEGRFNFKFFLPWKGIRNPFSKR